MTTTDQLDLRGLDVECVTTPGEPTAVMVPNRPDVASACAWLASVRTDLRAALDRHGALYLPGLPVRDADDFAQIRDTVVDRRASYKEKATPRSAFGNDVFSSTDLPPAQAIRMHNENSYTLTFPGTLLFCCLVAPTASGATPTADVRTVLREIPPQLADRFRRLGWGLTRSFSDHISLDWRTSFGAESPADVARYCDDHRIGHRWLSDGTLRTTQCRSAIITHPRTGDEVWFNHAAFWSEWSLDPDIREVLVAEFGPDGLPFATSFGDGSALTPADVEALNHAYERATVRRAWRPGDLLLVDNILAAHGRDPFQGDRRIVVAMGDPVPVDACRPTVAPHPDLTG